MNYFKMNALTAAILLYLIGQTLIFFQTNGQFFSKWFATHPIFLSIVGGSIISYCFILGTKYAFEYFEGLLWPGRFMGFAIGVSSYAILTYIFMGEGISWKTATSLVLSVAIIWIQLFWK